jgi:hypothetical protein
LEATSV